MPGFSSSPEPLPAGRPAIACMRFRCDRVSLSIGKAFEAHEVHEGQLGDGDGLDHPAGTLNA